MCAQILASKLGTVVMIPNGDVIPTSEICGERGLPYELRGTSFGWMSKCDQEFPLGDGGSRDLKFDMKRNSLPRVVCSHFVPFLGVQINIEK